MEVMMFPSGQYGGNRRMGDVREVLPVATRQRYIEKRFQHGAA
jgi:hypothetical protein